MTSPLGLAGWARGGSCSRFRFLKDFKIEDQLFKTIVYVDGFNLYYSLRETPYRWLDIKKLVNSILKNNDVVAIKYFTSLVKSSETDPSKPERQKAYLRALESIPEIEIIKGSFKKRGVKGRLIKPLNKGIEKGEIVQIHKYEEKESDVNIACHIIKDCILQDIECIVLLSNDTDLKTPLRIARKEFGKRIGIISPHKHTHQELKKISHFSRNVKGETLDQCQFPEWVGKVPRPHGW